MRKSALLLFSCLLLILGACGGSHKVYRPAKAKSKWWKRKDCNCPGLKGTGMYSVPTNTYHI